MVYGAIRRRHLGFSSLQLGPEWQEEVEEVREGLGFAERSGDELPLSSSDHRLYLYPIPTTRDAPLSSIESPDFSRLEYELASIRRGAKSNPHSLAEAHHI